jgi:hypothetical protein
MTSGSDYRLTSPAGAKFCTFKTKDDKLEMDIVQLYLTIKKGTSYEQNTNNTGT